MDAEKSAVVETSAVSAKSPDSYLSGWQLAAVIFSLFLGVFVVSLDTSIIGVVIPSISSHFHALDDAAWYGSSYLLTITAFQPLMGTMYKFFKVELVFQICLVVFEVGSILCAAATNSPMFIVGRAVAGTGAAGILQGALSIIAITVVLEKRPLYQGIVISVFVISVCVGPVLGGAFTTHGIWRWCFWINRAPKALLTATSNVPIGGVTLVLLLFVLRIRNADNDNRSLPLKEKLKHMDPIGCIVFIGAVTYYMPYYFQAVQGADAVHSGVDLIAVFIPQMLAVIVTSALVTQWGYYVPYMIVGELICIAGTVMLTRLKVESSTVYWAAALVVHGMGMGLAMQLPYTAVNVVLQALAIAISQTISLNNILREVPRQIPELSPERVMAWGASNLQALAPTADALIELRSIWCTSVSHVMIFALACICASVLFTAGMERLNAKEVANQRREAGGEAGQVGVGLA
ncbi:hypothetical protein APSETT445_008963 [Aspergillus pseudonomiae]